MSKAHPRPDDRTARARIRHAALWCFARGGFSTSLRVIADRAGVSVPLITHHYLTKEALRRTCDDWVLERFLDLKILAIRRPETVSRTLSDTAEASVMTVYMLRSFLDATSSARSFFEHFVERLRTVMAAATQAGIVNPSEDDEERLHLLAAQSIGILLVEFVINPPDDPREFMDRVYTSRTLVAQLDLYSHPLFTPSAPMETYLEYARSKGAQGAQGAQAA